MKTFKQITSVLFFFFIISIGFASNYEQKMGENLQKMYQTTSIEELTALSNAFERIAVAEVDKWLPYYYAAFSNVSIVTRNKLEPKQTLLYLDKAQEELDRAQKVKSDEAEIYVLQGLIYQLRITDPANGYKYSTLSTKALKRAQTLDSNNPRAIYLLGSNIFHTPEMYGGGAEKAKPILDKAMELFKSTQPKNPLMPIWGQHHLSHLLLQYQ